MAQNVLEKMCYEMEEIARKYGYSFITKIELLTESFDNRQFHKVNYERNIIP